MKQLFHLKRFAFYGSLSFLWACTGEKSSSVPNYQISFSEELSLDFGEVGMSSEVPFDISPLDKNNSSFLVFNTFYRRLDTVSFSPEKKRIVPGLEVPKEGPGSIPGFSSFIHINQENVYLTGNSIFYLKDGETVKYNLENEDGKLNAIRGTNPKNKVAYLSSLETKFLYVIIQDHSFVDLSLYRFDFELRTFEEVPFNFTNMEDHIISYKRGPATATNGYFPFITLSDFTLILSYPFKNQISKIDLRTLKQFDYSYTSNYFKSEKDIPEIKSSFDDISEFIEASYKWDEDMYFGTVYKLNSDLMYRVVNDFGKSPNLVFLELFDNSFKKVGEFNLTAFEPDLKGLHITVEGKILIQSSKEPDEDIFKYYLLSVDPI